MENKAVFLDRDGVINFDFGYVGSADRFEFIPKAIDGMKLLVDSGYKLVVITNQSGVARGKYTETSVIKLHDYMCSRLCGYGVFLNKIYYCPHHPEGKIAKLAYNCDCRKPNTGMIDRGVKELNLDISKCALVGDKLSDIKAGRSAMIGLNIGVASGQGAKSDLLPVADVVCSDLFEASQIIANTNT